MDSEKAFTTGDLCAALDMPVARFKSMRQRDQLPYVDASALTDIHQIVYDDDGNEVGKKDVTEAWRAAAEEGRTWQRFDLEDIAALGAQMALVDDVGMDVKAASKIVFNARGYAHGVPHPSQPHPDDDVMIGAIIYAHGAGRGHFGGTFAEVRREIDRATEKSAADGPEVSAVLMVNFSAQVRRVALALALRSARGETK